MVVALERSVCDIDRVYRPAIASEWCDSDVPGHVSFCTTVLEWGIGLPMHPFFVDFLDFYNLSPTQLTLVSWLYMMAALILYHREGLGIPTVTEWRNSYKLQISCKEGKLYYFTKWSGASIHWRRKYQVVSRSRKRSSSGFMRIKIGRRLGGNLGILMGLLSFYYLLFIFFVVVFGFRV